MMVSFRCWCFLWCTVNVIGGGILVTTNAAQVIGGCSLVEFIAKVT
jgi:hypothetical protein